MYVFTSTNMNRLKIIFDESVFCDGSIFNMVKTDPIFVSNAVEKFLLERLGYKTTNVCAESNISLNPVNPCSLMNVRSLQRRFTTNNFMFTYSHVHVFRNSVIRMINSKYTIKPLELSEPNINVIYDINENMSSMEMALLIKLYSFTIASGSIIPTTMEASIKITATLFHTVQEWFSEDTRHWFMFDSSNFIIKNHIGHYKQNNVLVNLPTYKITLADHPIT